MKNYSLDGIRNELIQKCKYIEYMYTEKNEQIAKQEKNKNRKGIRDCIENHKKMKGI